MANFVRPFEKLGCQRLMPWMSSSNFCQSKNIKKRFIYFTNDIEYQYILSFAVKNHTLCWNVSEMRQLTKRLWRDRKFFHCPLEYHVIFLSLIFFCLSPFNEQGLVYFPAVSFSCSFFTSFFQSYLSQVSTYYKNSNEYFTFLVGGWAGLLGKY